MNNAPRLRSPDRRQLSMLAQDLDSLVPQKHRVRGVWTVVEALDFTELLESIRAREGVVGRDATDPKLLFALWLYATIRGVGSARELSRLCEESAPYKWLCGGVSINYHTLADFRVAHGEFLDDAFSFTIASLVQQEIVQVRRISQDGTRVRASAGTSSFRRTPSLKKILKDARRQVRNTKALLASPARSAQLSSKKKAARLRAVREREERVKRAIAALPELKRRQKKLERKLTKKQKEEVAEKRQPRASTTDPDARKMKMPDGGTSPALNFQFGVDTESRAIVGVEVINQGTDAGQLVPMREQIERRTGLKVEEHLADGGYLTHADIETAHAQGVSLYIPPRPRRNEECYGDEFTPKKGESEAIAKWRVRMGTAKGKSIYLERGSTVETVNGDQKEHRGLRRLTVRGVAKAKSIALWAALAYNVFHFAEYLKTAT